MGFMKPKKPKVQPVAMIPDDNDPAVLRAKRMSILSAQGQGGRQSTIMSGDGGDALGDTPRALQ